MSSRAGRIARGLGGLVALTVLVAGVPVGLLTAGDGPGIHLRHIRPALMQPISDSALVRLTALACWLVWLLFAAAVAIELLAALRAGAGRARAHIRIPAFQGTANALVLSALLLLPQRGLALGAVTRDPMSPPVATAVVRPAPALIVSSHPVQETRVAGSVKTVRYVVQRYDSPWGIAERHLGDGTRWRELRDEHGRSLSLEASADDHVAGGHRPQARIIRPGEVLYLPEGPARASVGQQASHPVVEVRPAAPAAMPTVVLAPAVTASHPSVAVPSTPPEVTSVATPSPSAAIPGLSAADPAGVGGLGPTSSSAPLSITAQMATPADQPPTIMEVTATRHARGSLSTTLVEAGLLSAGVFATLEALRRRQAQHRPAGRRLRLPGRALAATESALRFGAQPEQVERIDRAMHHLVADLQAAQTAVPSVLAVVAGPTSLEVLLGTPLPPPAPWTSSAEGFRWRLATAQLAPIQAPGSAPLPGLVAVGKAGQDGADVLLNLEAAGLLCVTGESETAAGVIRSLATSLSGLNWAQAVNLILVGFGSELEPVSHVRVVESLTSVLAELGSTAQLLGEAIGDSNAFASRVRRPGSDGWAPTIVCCAKILEPVERAELVRLAKPGTGVIAVINGDPEPSAWTIDVDSRPMAVQPLRLAVDPTLLDAEDLQQIGDLYAVAIDDSGVTSEEAPYRDLDITADQRPPTLAERLQRIDPIPEPDLDIDTTDRPPSTLAERLEHIDPVAAPVGAARPGGPIIAVNGNGKARRSPVPLVYPITVSILGTVEIDGATVFKRAKSKELAVYLALHPNGVGEAELDEALWPSGQGRMVVPSTRDSTVSVARTALGGPTRLLPAQGQGREKRYQVSEDVGTDWSRFCQFHRDGRAAQDTRLLGQALELIRGRPFEGVISGRTYGWVHTEGHARHIEAEVADAADLAAQLLLAKGQAIDARWAARRGLMADPYVERLWVRLMEGADQLGDGQEIERIMDEMDVVLELQSDFSGLHPQTLAAYDRLSRRRRLPT